MKYTYKEYTHVFDTPAKIEQETVIVHKIMDLLNQNKYNDIHDFINKNQTYQDFLKNNDLTNVVKHFGNTLNEADFKRILEQMVNLTNKKKSFDKENVETTSIGDKEYNTYIGEDRSFFLDNSHSDKSIERQLQDLQVTEQKFQTADPQKNTENMMNELERNKKENLNLRYLNDINIDLLNDKQKEVFTAFVNYQLNSQKTIRVDIDREVLVDESNNIMRIQRDGENISIVSGDSKTEESNVNQQKSPTKSLQKSLIPSTNTIYSDNN